MNSVLIVLVAMLALASAFQPTRVASKSNMQLVRVAIENRLSACVGLRLCCCVALGGQWLTLSHLLCIA